MPDGSRRPQRFCRCAPGTSPSVPDGSRLLKRGWCAANGMSYPMHKSESRGSDSKHVVSQVQADSWCAAAFTRTQSSTADPAFVLSNSTALPALVSLVVPVAVGVPGWSLILVPRCAMSSTVRARTSPCASAQKIIGTVSELCHMPPETLGEHRHLATRIDEHRCRGKWFIRTAFVGVDVRQHAQPESISKRAPSTTRTSLRIFRISGLRASG